MVSWNIVVVSSVANVVVSCLLCRQQEHAGLNPTESMTRALISDDNIARQSALGPVQLGYVLPLLVTPPIPVMLNPKNPKSWMSPGIVGPIIDSPNKTTRSNDATIRRSKNLNTLNYAFKKEDVEIRRNYLSSFSSLDQLWVTFLIIFLIWLTTLWSTFFK